MNPQFPTQSQPAEQPKPNPRHSIPVVATLGFILVIAVGVGYWMWNKAQEPAFIPASSNEGNGVGSEPDQAGWKTYRNEEYGFEMKYPEKLVILSAKSTVPDVAIAFGLSNSELKNEYLPQNDLEIYVYVYKNKYSNLNEFAEKASGITNAQSVILSHNESVGSFLAKGSEISNSDVIFMKLNTEIAEIRAIKQILECKKFCAYLGRTGKQISYFFEKDSIFYVMFAKFSFDQPEWEKEFEKIASSFKFIE